MFLLILFGETNMKKSLIFVFIILGLIIVWIILAHPKDSGNIEEPSVGIENKPGHSYIKKVTASGVRAELHLRSTGNPIKIVHIPGTKVEMEVAPATYTPDNIRLLSEQNGDKWWVQPYKSWGKLEEIKVEPGRTTELKFGPPLIIKTDVSANGREASIDLLITGQANERYYPGAWKNDQRQPAPELKIVDEAGKVLVTDRFKYG